PLVRVVAVAADPGAESRRLRNRRNDESLVVRISDPEISVLLTGDVEREGERELLESGADLESSVVKVPHHGSPTSSGRELLSRVHAAIAVVPVGADNPFGFPNAAVIRRWESAGA